MNINSSPSVSPSTAPHSQSTSILPPILKPIIGNSKSLFENPLQALYKPTLPSFPLPPILRDAVQIDGTVNIMLPPLLRSPSIQSEEDLPTETTILKYPNGERYLGEVKGGKRWGRGTMMNNKGGCLTQANFISEGIYKNDLLNGFGIWHCDKDKSYEGMFKDGKPHGYGEIKDRKSKKTLFEGYFECGRKVCGKEDIVNRKFFIGFFDKEGNRAHGYLIEMGIFEVLYHGSFKDNQPLKANSQSCSLSSSSLSSISSAPITLSQISSPVAPSSSLPPLLPRKNQVIIPEKTRSHTPSTSSSLRSVSSSTKILSRVPNQTKSLSSSLKAPLSKGVKAKALLSSKNIKNHSTPSVKNCYATPPKMPPPMSSQIIPSTNPPNYSSIFNIENDTITYPDGSVYTGNTLNKKRNGFGRMVDSEGHPTYQGFYKDDLKEGFGMAINPDGSTYIGLHSKGLRHGFGEYKKKDQTMTGFFVQDHMSTGKEIILGNDSHFIGNYMDGRKQEGILLDNIEKTILYYGPFVNDAPHGFRITWIRKGAIFTGNCFAGKFQGMLHMKLPDGEEWYGKVTDDLPNGFASHRDKEGNLVSQVYYERGEVKEGISGIIRLSVNRYYYGPVSGSGPTGKGFIKDKDGKRIFYYGGMLNGLKQGWGTEYAADGTVEYAGEFNEGERVDLAVVDVPGIIDK